MINLPIKYSQFDSRWGGYILGNNTDPRYNIYNYGCLLTCLVEVVSYFGHQISPLELNNALKVANPSGFGAGSGNYVWGTIMALYPDIKEYMTQTPGKLTDDQMATIKTALDGGFPVMFCIDYNPPGVQNNFHYVLALSYNPADENDITILDPLGGVIKSLKNYLGIFPSARRTIENFSVYLGPRPTASSSNSITIPIEANENNVQKASQWDEVLSFFDITNHSNVRFVDTILPLLKPIIDRSERVEKMTLDLETATNTILAQQSQLTLLNDTLLKEREQSSQNLKEAMKAKPKVEKLNVVETGKLTEVTENLMKVIEERGQAYDYIQKLEKQVIDMKAGVDPSIVNKREQNVNIGSILSKLFDLPIIRNATITWKEVEHYVQRNKR